MATSKKPAKVTKIPASPKRRGRPRKNQQPKTKPLPPPVPVESSQPESGETDPFQLSGMFQPSPSPEGSKASSATSSETEPRPGQPLGPEAEELLSQIAAADDDDGTEDEGPKDAAAMAAPAAPSSIVFKPERVRAVLGDSFDWLAEKFDSDHWRLTDNQADMLAEPTAQLLGSAWTHVQRMLPLWLERWSQETPGLMDFVLAFSFVVGPKAAQQFALSRERRRNPKPKQRRAEPRQGAGPQPVPAPEKPAPAAPPDPEGPEVGVELESESF